MCALCPPLACAPSAQAPLFLHGACALCAAFHLPPAGQNGGRVIERCTIIHPARYGSMAFKLTHRCDAKLHARSVQLPAWGYGLSVPIIAPLHGQPPTFQLHEELSWDYCCEADTPEEEELCLCGAANCMALLSRWHARPHGEMPAVLDGQGESVDMRHWGLWLKQLCTTAAGQLACVQPAAGEACACSSWACMCASFGC